MRYLLALTFALATPLLAADDPVDRLLAVPAPPPGGLRAAEYARQFANEPPDENNPMEVIARFWSVAANRAGRPLPSPRLREVLSRHLDEFPELLPGLTEVLPPRGEVYVAVRRIYDAKAPILGAEWAAPIRLWLRRHSGQFREELVAAATAAHEENGMVRGAEDLQALARLDWPAAEPILKKAAAGAAPRLRALALSLMFTHQAEAGAPGLDPLRRSLQAIVTDPTMPGYARNTALQAVMATDWPEHAAWFQGLFADPSLVSIEDGSTHLAPLAETASLTPSLWQIPIQAMLASPNRAIHNAAANTLAQMTGGTLTRTEVAIILVPWLEDAGWADSAGDSRARVVAAAGDLRVKEAERGLLSVAAHDPSMPLRLSAAEGLVRLRSEAAVGPLKTLLETGDEHQRRHVAELLVESDGLTGDEIANALEAYALFTTAPPEQQGDRISTLVSIGEAYARREAVERDDAATLVMKGADALAKSNAAASALLRALVWKWPVPAVDAAIVLRLGAGDLDRAMVAAALDRRELLGRQLAGPLALLTKRKTAVAGVAVLLLGDRAGEVRLLESPDTEAKRGLLAAARLASESLPVSDVVALMKGRDAKVALAAEKYLEAEDSRSAREALMARHAGEARLYGWRPAGSEAHVSLDHWEEELRASVRSGQWDEIYGLAVTGYSGREDRHIVVKSRGEQATLVKDGKERPMTAEQVAELHNFLASRSMDDAPPLDPFRTRGLVMEYVHLTKNGGRRVIMHDPMSASLGAADYLEVARKFEGL
jgi:hypothetical protein